MPYTQDIISKLDKIANNIIPLNNSRFAHLEYQVQDKLKEFWVYPEPLRISEEFGVYAEEGKVSNLNFPETNHLLKLLEDKIGINPRLGSLKENFNVAYSRYAREYKNKVLKPYQVYTENLIKKNDHGVDIRRVLGTKFVDKETLHLSPQILFDEEEKEILPERPLTDEKIVQTQYKVGPILQKEMMTDQGYFDNFKVIPANIDMRSRGLGCWAGSSFDKENLSVAECNWNCGEEVFNADSTSPLRRYSFVVLPIWTDQNPKK